MNQRLLTLETCCGYGYGLERGALPHLYPCVNKEYKATHHSLTITDFQGPDRVHRTPQEPWCFTIFASLSLAEPIPGIQDLNKKRQLFPRLDTTSVRLFALPLLVVYLRTLTCPATKFRNINLISFRYECGRKKSK